MKELTKVLDEILRGTKGSEIAAVLGKSESYVTQIRNGAQVPTDLTLAVLSSHFSPARMVEMLVAAAIARATGKATEDTSPNNPNRKENSGEVTRGRERAIEALKRLEIQTPTAAKTVENDQPRSFRDFPDAFYPLAIVTGDKREDGGLLLNAADLGAYSATPADTRWLLELGLRDDVLQHVDKNFILLEQDELVERFAEVNLLIVASPSANHLARVANRTAIWRLNYPDEAAAEIDKIIEEARRAPNDAAKLREQSKQVLKGRMRSFFTGGIFDPTNPPDYVVAQYHKIAPRIQLDFGILTFAENPFYAAKCRMDGRPNDHRFVSIIAAGMHHPATAHALRRLSKRQREDGVFEKHPYGGAIRVIMDMTVAFPKRVESAECKWEDEVDGSREPAADQLSVLRENLRDIERRLKGGQMRHLALTASQAAESLRLIESLANVDTRSQRAK